MTRTFSAEHLAGKSTNSPFIDRVLPGRVEATFHQGYATVEGGAVVETETIARAAAAVSARRVSAETGAEAGAGAGTETR